MRTYLVSIRHKNKIVKEPIVETEDIRQRARELADEELAMHPNHISYDVIVYELKYELDFNVDRHGNVITGS